MSEVFVYDAVRIPFGRYAGALAGCRPDDLAAHVVRTLVGRAPGLDPARVDEVVLGNANGAGEDNRNVAQSVACVRAWNIDPAIVNAHGGAIAIGHPLGASGTRILGTLARSLVNSGQRWGVAAICIGVGQGLAIVLENAGR